MEEERITEYTLIFKEGTELYKEYNGEFISEDKWQTDNIFENHKEQIEQYFSKDWVRYLENIGTEDEQYTDWEEDFVEVFYNGR